MKEEQMDEVKKSCFVKTTESSLTLEEHLFGLPATTVRPKLLIGKKYLGQAEQALLVFPIWFCF